MKKLFIFILTIILFLMSGCSSSEPWVEDVYLQNIYPASDNLNDIGNELLVWNEIYVDSIYVGGTLISDNTSIVGSPGAAGAPGADGEDGQDGIDGVDGNTESWFPVGYSSLGIQMDNGFAVGFLSNGLDKASTSIYAMHDVTENTTAYVVFIPQSTQTDVNFKLYSSYGTFGEQSNTHTASSSTYSINVTSDKLERLDVTYLITNMLTDDVGTIWWVHEDTANIGILGVNIKWD